MIHVIELFNVRFRVSLSGKRYSLNLDQPILEIHDYNSGVPAGTLTKCIPGSTLLNKNETILRHEYCELMVAELERAGVAIGIGKFAFSGYAKYPIVKLTESFLESQASVVAS
jgi:hypothetical protein